VIVLEYCIPIESTISRFGVLAGVTSGGVKRRQLPAEILNDNGQVPDPNALSRQQLLAE
jgi:hypothetical protein